MDKKCHKDLIGKIFGDLTVKAKAEDKLYGPTKTWHERQWLCVCTCGKETIVRDRPLRGGQTTSCGHKKHDAMVAAAKTRFKDLSGTTFGSLDVLRRVDDYVSPNGRKYIMYEVQCQICGKIKTVRSNNLRSGSTITCGSCGPHSLRDLTGKQFGDLTVIKRLPDVVFPSGSRRITWECICTCGQLCSVDGQALRDGTRTDCGHSGCSLAEKEIRNILNEYKIRYVPEYVFEDLKSTKDRALRFDFAVFRNNKLAFLLEYQGIQHYWTYQYGYTQREYTDKMKKEYCKEHNIKLFEIKYDEVIQEKLLEILHDNSVLSSDNSEKV